MEKKMNVSEFAELVGTTSKTIYGKINNYDNLPVIEQLHTVNEKVKGREIRLIVTNSEQIEYYQNIYGKKTVIDGEYYETVTDNNGLELVNEVYDTVKANNNSDLLSKMFDKLNTVHNEYNNRLQQVNDELITYKSKTLLLEDKAGREGFYLNEINELKKENNRNKLYNKVLITVITILLLFITGFITYNIAVNKSTIQVEEKTDQVSEQVTVQVPAPPAPVQVSAKPVQKPVKKK